MPKRAQLIGQIVRLDHRLDENDSGTTDTELAIHARVEKKMKETSYFGLIKECMDLSRIHITAQNHLYFWAKNQHTYSNEIFVFYFYFIFF